MSGPSPPASTDLKSRLNMLARLHLFQTGGQLWVWHDVGAGQGFVGFLGLVGEEEDACGNGAADEVGDEMNPNLRRRDDLHDGCADGDGRIERAAGNSADRERAGQHGEADGQAVEGVVLRPLGRRDVEDDIAEREGKEERRAAPAARAR